MSDKACRDEFEREANNARFFPAELSFERTKSPRGRDEYVNSHLQSRWEGWQAAWNRRAPEVPEGWKLVPVESTGKMDDEGLLSLPDGLMHIDAERCYRAMITAAPQPPKST